MPTGTERTRISVYQLTSNAPVPSVTTILVPNRQDARAGQVRRCEALLDKMPGLMPVQVTDTKVVLFRAVTAPFLW